MKPIIIKPGDGGALLADASGGNIGFKNYRIKRDWRRSIDVEMRAEGHVKFAPNLQHAETGQAYPPGVDGPITVISKATLPSGYFCVVTGTATTLWAYFGLSDPTYVLGDGNGLYVAAGYFDDQPGDWVQIYTGSAGERWEAVQVGSWLVLNNGVDLPMTYRVGESAAVPIYELREQGIASVGTIAEINGILCCMDIRQIPTKTHTALMSSVAAAVDGNVVGAYSLGFGRTVGIGNGTVVSDSPVFNIGMIGRSIKFLGNVIIQIGGYIGNTYSAILANPTSIAVTTVQSMKLVPLIASDDRKVTPNAATLFPNLDSQSLVGQSLIWNSGETAKISSVAGGYFYVSSDRAIPAGPLKVENPAAYARYTGSLERRHNRKLWSMPNLPRRFAAQIPVTVNRNSNLVTLTWPAKSLVAGMSVLIVGAGVGGDNLTVEVLLAYPNGILVKGQAITLASEDVTLAIAAAVISEAEALASKTSAALTLATAQTALAAAIAAHLKGPDLLATIPITEADLTKAQADASAAVDAALSANPAAITAYDTAVAATATARESVQTIETSLVAADAEASIAGLYADLEGDGSGIVKALKWGNNLAIYKPSGGIFVARYTGDVAAPFVYEEIRVPPECCLPARHRFTLLAVNDTTHIWAAGSDIYEFNTAMRYPQIFKPLQWCSGVFFDAVGEDKFACNNSLTQEVMFCCPSNQGLDKALCYDYLYQTARTTGMAWTAGETIWQPMAAEVTTVNSWFLGGTSAGGLMRYGLTNDAIISVPGGTRTAIPFNLVVNSGTPVFTRNMIGRTIISASGYVASITGYQSPTQVVVMAGAAAWSEAFRILPACWHRDGADYDSILQTGLEDFGSPHSEKLLNSYVLIPSNNSPGTTQVEVMLRGGANPAKAVDVQGATITDPNNKNLLKPTVARYYLGDRLTIRGKNNPFEVQEKILTIVPRNSSSFGRRGNGT